MQRGRKEGLRSGKIRLYPYRKLVSFDEELKSKIEKLAVKHELCFAEVIRQCLRKALEMKEPPTGKIF